jgi:hypothetical protein
MIGELEAVADGPMAFSSESLDIRHRLPDRKVKELAPLLVGTEPLLRVSKPQCMRVHYCQPMPAQKRNVKPIFR